MWKTNRPMSILIDWLIDCVIDLGGCSCARDLPLCYSRTCAVQLESIKETSVTASQDRYSVTDGSSILLNMIILRAWKMSTLSTSRITKRIYIIQRDVTGLSPPLIIEGLVRYNTRSAILHLPSPNAASVAGAEPRGPTASKTRGKWKCVKRHIQNIATWHRLCYCCMWTSAYVAVALA